MIYKVKSENNEHDPKARYIKPRTFSQEFKNSYKAWIKRKTRKHFVKPDMVLKVVSKIFENTAEALIERDAGVVLEGIGYFAFYRPCYRRFGTTYFKGGNIAPPKYKTKYYNYHPYLFTDVFSHNRLKGWSMERAFGRTFDRLYKKKHRYRLLYYKQVKELYKTTS